MSGTLTLVLLTFTVGLGGCSSTTQFDGLVPASGGSTVAFESIDGPPPGVFDKLVAVLGTEAEARNVAVVSRTGPADYRVRGYLTTAVSRGQVSLSWVWDVYDADRRRALRIGGEEVVSGRHRDAWGVVSEDMLRRIARTGMERVADFLKSPRRPAPSGPAQDTVRIAAATASGEPPRLAALGARP